MILPSQEHIIIEFRFTWSLVSAFNGYARPQPNIQHFENVCILHPGVCCSIGKAFSLSNPYMTDVVSQPEIARANKRLWYFSCPRDSSSSQMGITSCPPRYMYTSMSFKMWLRRRSSMSVSLADTITVKPAWAYSMAFRTVMTCASPSFPTWWFSYTFCNT